MTIPKELPAKQNQDPLAIFTYALRAPETRRQWPRRLKVFDFLELNGTLDEQARAFVFRGCSDPRWIEDSMVRFLIFQIRRAAEKEISESTIRNYYKAMKLFCEMNDLILNWKKVSRGLPPSRKSANDRAPTIEEIKKVVGYPDRRIKAVVYIMASTGIRIGAWDFLKWKHVIPLTDDRGEIVSAKLQVYSEDNEQYCTFMTREAYLTLKDWMDFRASFDIARQ